MSDRPKVFEGIDWARGTDRGYHVVTIGPDATPEDVQAFRDAYELGCAWAEAEAALPEGGRIEYVEWISPGYRAAASIMGEWFYGEGDTPAAALRALAERLRERTG